MSKEVSREIRAERSRMLHILSGKKRRYFQDQFIKRERPVLFEHMKNGKIIGHTDNYIKVKVNYCPNLINEIQAVCLTINHGDSMYGALVD